MREPARFDLSSTWRWFLRWLQSSWPRDARQQGPAGAPERALPARNFLIEQSDVAILTWDDDDRIVHCNASASQLLACPHSELIGQPVHRLLAPTGHDDFARLRAQLRISSAAGVLPTRVGLHSHRVYWQMRPWRVDGIHFCTASLRLHDDCPAQRPTDALGQPSRQASGHASPRATDGHADLRASLQGLVWALHQVDVAQLDQPQAAHLRTAQVAARQLLDSMGDDQAFQWRSGGQGSLRSEPEVMRDSVVSIALHLPASPAGPSVVAGWTATDPKSRPRRPLRLLHADDSAEHRLLVSSFLQGTGWQVDEASNGEEALCAWQRDRHDAVMLDWQMPVLDGLATARGIRAVEQRLGWSPVPIVTVTASSSPEAKIAARGAGANAHLDKPLARDRLIEVLAHVAAPAAGEGFEAAAAAQTPPSVVYLRVAAYTVPCVLGFLHQIRSELDDALAVQTDTELGDLAHLAHGMAETADELGLDTLCVALSALEHAALSKEATQVHAQLRALTAQLADVRVEAL